MPEAYLTPETFTSSATIPSDGFRPEDGSMWKNIGVVLEGEVVRLEPLARRHEQGLFEAAQDERIWRWMPYDASATRETFHAYVEDALAASETGTEATFATVDASTSEPVGSTRYLALRPEHRALEIGWTWLAPAYWKTGANTEAKLLMLEHAFEQLGCLRVEFKTDARNERSRGALAALPAQFEGVFRKHMLVRGGERRDSAYFSIVDEEWPEVRDNLRQRLDAVHSETGAPIGRRRTTVAEAMQLLPGPAGERFAKALGHGSMEVEVYAPRGRDQQTPHTRDELYAIVGGSGEFINGPERHPFGPGDVLFVPAGVEHRFVGFTDDLVVWVVFYGPEGGETG